MTWLVTMRERPDAVLRLVCLPHAGGGASAFRSWIEPDPNVEIHALALPGRERRFGEPLVVDVGAITTAISTEVAPPYAVFGHSFGARLGFELIRELRRRGAVLPVVLAVAASGPPDRPDGFFSGASRSPDPELVARLAEFGGVPAEVLAEPEFMTLLLPALRTDFGWLDNYEFTTEAALPVPILGFAGSDDRFLAPAQMAAWSRHTGIGFGLTTLAGDHFFPSRHPGQIISAIRAVMPDPVRYPAGDAAVSAGTSS